MQFWSALLTAIPALMAIALWRNVAQPGVAIVVGLAAFGVVFAMNSSIHSYLVLAYTDVESVSLNVGFYYMANAGGRLLGTLLSGWVYLAGGHGGLPVVLSRPGGIVVAEHLEVAAGSQAPNLNRSNLREAFQGNGSGNHRTPGKGQADTHQQAIGEGEGLGRSSLGPATNGR